MDIFSGLKMLLVKYNNSLSFNIYLYTTIYFNITFTWYNNELTCLPSVFIFIKGEPGSGK